MRKLVLMLALALTAGCGHKPAPEPPHGHEHHAPHGGALVVLGEEVAHVELVLDPATGELRAYSLDGEAEKAVPLAQSEIVVSLTKPAVRVQLTAQASELTGEKAGNTSEFAGSNPALKNLPEFDGKLLRVDTLGQSFRDVSFNFPRGNE